MTGMSDSMRTDFRVIKCIAEHTRLVPKTRVEVNITPPQILILMG